IDIFPPLRGRAKPDRLDFLRAMEIPAPEDALLRLLEIQPAGVALKNFAITWNLTPGDADALWDLMDMVLAGPVNARVGFSAANWDRLGIGIETELRLWHEANPDKSGPAQEGLRKLIPHRLAMPVFESLAAHLVSEKRLVHLGSGYCLPGFEARLSPQDEALWKKVKPELEDGHMQPPVVAELSERVNAPKRDLERFLVRAAKLGLVFQVAKNRFLLPDALLELADTAEDLAAQTGEAGFGAAAFRDRTKIGRNLAIELLEYFDAKGLTWRSGDTRKLRKPVSEVFGAIV
ncbi:MAG: SelB C-terminal domain-containing protein, partial [Rhodospirillales bacterium]|nr:SelB C-terminal domain-containing protein [Rhodospirillales bacterium]